ncbi:hypothetical protein [Streptomyces sp. NBC_00566]|uniref:hypothetical protein n=1 Tax=Streptomyces sp. NBC_00566 TaxID=2975778 RepID=UPI002E813B1D|nr:hypothetical protein [Streptomyces sp. NBC_00566]WUB90845.1 hypothetical protein OG812_29640 [Streptomyces sp. NBC_00566]
MAVTAGLGLLRPACGGDHLGEHREEAARGVDVRELTQDRCELAGIEVVGAEVVLDLLDGEGRNPDQARTRSSRVLPPCLPNTPGSA